jgi:transcriptional regulator
VKYGPADEARVAGLRASGLTHKQIAQRTGTPRTSVSLILQRAPVAQVVTRETRESVSAALWQVVAQGTEEAIRRIHDPKTKAGELAQLLRVAAEQHAMLTGQATSNINVNARIAGKGTSDEWQMTPEEVQARYDEERIAAQFWATLEAMTDEEAEAWLGDGGMKQLRQAQLQAGEEAE